MKKWLIGFWMLAMCSLAYSAPSTTITIPNSFTPNTTIQSSQVNDNFNQCQTQYNSHTHTDITSVGAITSGSWLGTPIGTTYGGTGQNFGAGAVGSTTYFSAVGTMSELTVGSNGQAIISNGTIPYWATVGGANDAILRGLELDYRATNSVVASAGVLYVGSTVINSATKAILYLDKASDWASGSTVTYAGGAGWCYIGVNTNSEIKLLGSVAPNICDLNDNKQGTKYYLYQPSTNASYWRVIGAIRVDTSNQIAWPFRQSGKRIFYDDVDANTNVRVLNGATAVAFTACDCSGIVPRISNVIDAQITFGAAVSAYFRPTGSGTTNGILYDGSSNTEVVNNLAISDLQSFDYTAGGGGITMYISSYELNIR